MNVTAVGIDLAKNVLQVHGVDGRGKVVLRRQLRRDQVTSFFAQLPPCLIGMEARASAHHWGRTLERFGHTVRLMAPQFVKPYVKANKTDVVDAEAVCEAVSRPNRRRQQGAVVGALNDRERAMKLSLGRFVINA